ncbi:hypothetical protein [Cumulibacter soli]|uniref:hypothetical protein n=1 Tax=Cumulibacter soli TaxID=2546344 RepID=UPI001FBAE713|nr:hypothetical protein [Cumulibacter soli]
MINETDRVHLRRSVDLARTALENGDNPFGVVLVDADSKVRFEDHNHASTGDRSQHAELAAARWARERGTEAARGGDGLRLK